MYLCIFSLCEFSTTLWNFSVTHLYFFPYSTFHQGLMQKANTSALCGLFIKSFHKTALRSTIWMFWGRLASNYDYYCDRFNDSSFDFLCHLWCDLCLLSRNFIAADVELIEMKEFPLPSSLPLSLTLTLSSICSPAGQAVIQQSQKDR